MCVLCLGKRYSQYTEMLGYLNRGGLMRVYCVWGKYIVNIQKCWDISTEVDSCVCTVSEGKMLNI